MPVTVTGFNVGSAAAGGVVEESFAEPLTHTPAAATSAFAFSAALPFLYSCAIVSGLP